MNARTAPALVMAATLALTLALGGCKKDKTPEHAAAKGEILPRSATDDMLPYDTVRSKAPLANPDAVKGDAGKPTSTATATESAGESAAPAAPATPSPAPAAAEVTPDAE
jgi:hypothetical protein